jgi:hypothetical protein
MRELRGASSHLDPTGSTVLLLRTVWQMSNAPWEAAAKVIALLMAAAPTENIAKTIGLTAARDGGANSLNAAHLRASSAQTTPNQSRQVTEKLKIPLKQSGRSRP